MTTAMHPEVAAELEAVRALRRDLEAEKERLVAGSGDDDASISVALREYESQFFNAGVPSIMNAACAHVSPEGLSCGLSWKLNNDTIRPVHRTPGGGTHSYRPQPLAVSDQPAGNTYHLSKREYESYGVEPEPPKTAVDTYLSEKQAAKLLAVTLKDLRAMVKAGTLAADKIGDVTLIRKEGVDRVLALAELARDAEGYEEDEDG